MQQKLKSHALACGLALGVSAMAQTEQAAQPIPVENTQPGKWNFAVSLYGLAAGQSGDVVVKGVPANLDLDFDQIWENLDSCGMGTVRIGYGRWALVTDIIYLGLEASGDKVDAEFDQWLVTPALAFQASEQVELFAGVMYNNLSAEISGPFGRRTSGTQEWWDPFVGADVNLPLTEKFSLHARGDVGGFGVGSDLTWQAFPYLDWRFAQWGSLQAGYRWLYADYEDSGEGFAYDVTTQGPQFGITGHF